MIKLSGHFKFWVLICVEFKNLRFKNCLERKNYFFLTKITAKRRPPNNPIVSVHKSLKEGST